MRFDTLDAWLAWQATLNPRTIELGLERVGAVWQRLGAPPIAATVITVAGTNGKGSSVAYLEAILQAAGYRTGCYTSPHLQRYNERIRIDRMEIDDARICAAFAAIDEVRGEIALTYFEFGTLAALWLFAAADLDAAILEVGLGGRLDAVNLIDTDLALITGIALDHTDWLGPDREAIGREKAGILRGGRPAVYAGEDIPDSIRNHARELSAPLYVAGADYRVLRQGDAWLWQGRDRTRAALPPPALRGRSQYANAAGVIQALELLRERLPVDQSALRSGLLGVQLAGRFEVRPGAPTWILDVAHNPQAIAALCEQLGDMYCAGDTWLVLGMLADKDVAKVADILAPRVDHWNLAGLTQDARGLSAADLAARVHMAQPGHTLTLHADVATAMGAIAQRAKAQDRVLVCGSFHTVGAAQVWLDRADRST